MTPADLTYLKELSQHDWFLDKKSNLYVCWGIDAPRLRKLFPYLWKKDAFRKGEGAFHAEPLRVAILATVREGTFQEQKQQATEITTRWLTLLESPQ